jgi:CheY-like chemotaxis protein
VLADTTQIHQIILNLCTNAWHAIGDRGGRIEVTLADLDVNPELARTRPGLRPGSYVRLRVADTGCGMDRATRERIFEPFFTTKPVGQGTGLGLAVVHGIMEGHEGAIFVESETGHGTTFDLFFPEHRAGAAVPALLQGPIPHGGGQHILLVEDNQGMQLATGRILEDLGYRVTAHLSTVDAVSAFTAQPGGFDLVLTDFSMPVMNGAELARKLIAIRPGLPVVLMSGHRLPREREFFVETGVRDVLMKPFPPEELARSVHGALELK